MSLLLQVSLAMLFSSLFVLLICFLVDTSSAKASARDFARATGFLAWKVMLGSVAGITVDIMMSLLS